MERCIRCHRPLKDSLSMRIGYGPKCFQLVTGLKFPKGGSKDTVVMTGHNKTSLPVGITPPLFCASCVEELEQIIEGSEVK